MPILGKIFEKIIFKRLYDFVTSKGILSENQFGFVKKKSTAHANLNVSDSCLKGIQEKSYTLAVFLDFSKAFDCVEHSLLLEKLQKYGIRGLPLNLLLSYLSNRTQKFVSIKNLMTCTPNQVLYYQKRKNSIVVPQGSCNGPLLYILYTNYLKDILKKVNSKVNITMFADDTCLTLQGSNLS